MNRALVLRREPGFSPIEDRPALVDDEIELRPFTDEDAAWLVDLARERPEVVETLLWPQKGARLDLTYARALVDVWAVGLGATWTVNAPDRKGLVFAVVPEYGSPRMALGGVKVPGAEYPPGQAARAARLVAAWVRETMQREPYAAIPCEEEHYIRWAEEAGLAWDTKLPGF